MGRERRGAELKLRLASRRKGPATHEQPPHRCGRVVFESLPHEMLGVSFVGTKAVRVVEHETATKLSLLGIYSLLVSTEHCRVYPR
jgi:hypothetical protein